MHPNRLSPPYQLFILTLSLFAIGLLALQTTQQMTQETSTILAYADYALCALFFLDFLICLYHAENRLHYFRTWGWLDLLSSIPMLEVARLGRAARALRIIRVLRGIRASSPSSSFSAAVKARCSPQHSWLFSSSLYPASRY